MMRPYLRDKINDHESPGESKVDSGNTVTDYKTQGERKIQLTMIINFISSKDLGEIRTMRTKSRNKEVTMGNEPHEIIEKSLLKKCQEGLEETMRESELVFDSVNLLHYNLRKITLNRGGSYVDSPKWPKNESRQ